MTDALSWSVDDDASEAAKYGVSHRQARSTEISPNRKEGILSLRIYGQSLIRFAVI